MEIIKKNLTSVIFGAVALVAIAASFFPLDGMFDSVRDEMKKRGGEWDKANSLLTQRRNMPNVDIHRSEEIPLGRFPSEEVCKSGKEMTRQVEAFANEIMKTAMEMNDPTRHHLPPADKNFKPDGKWGLLVEKILPPPTNAAELFDRDMQRGRFRDRYDDVMRNYGVAAGNVAPGAAAVVQKPGELVALLHATTAPSQGEVASELQRKQESWSTRYGDMPPMMQPGAGPALPPDPAREAAIKAREEQRRKEILDRVPYNMRLERARAGWMYIDPVKGLHYNAQLLAAKQAGTYPNNDVDIWWAQVGLWIQRDVIASILQVQKSGFAASKATTQNVLTCPIKHLRGILITEGFVTGNGLKTVTGRGSGAPGEAPRPGQPGTAEPAGDPTKWSSTARVCNPVYDVIHFTIAIDIDSRYLTSFISELQRDRLICVRDASVRAADKVQLYNDGFVYVDREAGADRDVPVVHATLSCEAIMLRDWTVKYMPEDVKRTLDIRPEGRP